MRRTMRKIVTWFKNWIGIQVNWVLWYLEEMSTFCKTEVSTVSCSSAVVLIFILSKYVPMYCNWDRTRLDHLVNFPINFNHEWWEPALPLGDDRSQSHYATKNQYSSKIYESFYLEPGAKNIDDHTGRWPHSAAGFDQTRPCGHVIKSIRWKRRNMP